MKKIFMSLAFLFFSGFVKRFTGQQQDYLEIARLKMSLMYVKSVEVFRLLFVTTLGMGICLIFLTLSLILFHTTLFLYAPWTVETKFIFGLVCSGVYLLAAILAFNKLFSQEKWLKIFHADRMADHLMGTPSQENDTPNPNGEKEHADSDPQYTRP